MKKFKLTKRHLPFLAVMIPSMIITCLLILLKPEEVQISFELPAFEIFLIGGLIVLIMVILIENFRETWKHRKDKKAEN